MDEEDDESVESLNEEEGESERLDSPMEESLDEADHDLQSKTAFDQTPALHSSKDMTE